MTRSARFALLSLVLLASIASTQAAAAATPAAPVSPEPALTDGRTFAHWAHPIATGAIRGAPRATAPLVARLRLLTEGGSPEVYPLLQAAVDVTDRRWLQVAIPGRPNGRTGWVREDGLGPAYRVTTRLVVDRARLRATLTRNGRAIWTARIGIGAPGSPTPAGSFVIREKLRVTAGGSYGPRAFGTSDYSTLTDWPGGGVIGIHGTDQPGLIPGRPSHGCIRLRNDAVVRLFELMPVGTPMRIT
jgi:hypothetical protein